jgi:hypothetical protein
MMARIKVTVIMGTEFLFQGLSFKALVSGYLLLFLQVFRNQTFLGRYFTTQTRKHNVEE